ncbi:MAG: hypothetical protein ACRDKG_10165, partial [Actinomycetota bacterium]
WLLSNVRTAMTWDDHDVHDDWNISHDWVQEYRQHEWWDQRIAGAGMSYFGELPTNGGGVTFALPRLPRTTTSTVSPTGSEPGGST